MKKTFTYGTFFGSSSEDGHSCCRSNRGATSNESLHDHG
jgi:hypothetical protein